MVRKLAVAMGFALACTATDAAAGPPVVRPIGIPTTCALFEHARHIAREADEPPAHDTPFRLRTIVIDPGHGGANEGAVGVAHIDEKHLTLDLAYAVRDALEARHPGVRVLLTRYWDRDVDLDVRTRWANEMGADLFLSLHYNAATHDRAVGYETYFLSDDAMAATAEKGSRHGQKGSKVQRKAWRKVDSARATAHQTAREPLVSPHERSKRLAYLVQRELASRLETPDRGVKQANFAVLRGALMPAVVVEAGFLTHPEEGRAVLSRQHQARVVEAVVTAVEAYETELTPTTTPGSAPAHVAANDE